jgi:alanyl-tRNA synthetase
MEDPFLHRLTASVIDLMQDIYPELVLSTQLVERVVRSEEERFRSTLATGITLFEQMLARSPQKPDKVLDGADAFKLYDTYGMPLDMLHELAGDHNVSVDTEGFEREMAGQKQRARESWKKTAVVPDKSVYGALRERGESQFLGYRTTVVDEARVVALIRDGAEVPTIGEGEEGEVFLDKTPFYAEAGGQVGDRGILAGPESVADVLDTQMPVPGLYSHQVRIRKGSLSKDQQVLARVDEHLRNATAANHTTTHMLHAALREVLGPHVKQSGSLVAPDRLRFDFSHFAPLQPRELEAIERRVNEKIQQDLQVATEEMTIEQALDRGAIAFFGEKYGDMVRVVGISAFSMELCGGTHLRQTGQAGLFVVTNESSIASGTRRIEALTGPVALDYVRSLRRIVAGVGTALKAQPDELIATALRQRDELRRRDKEIEHLKLELATQADPSSASDSTVTEIGKIRVWTPKPLKNYDKRQHRQIVDAFKNDNQGRSWVAISGAVNSGKVSVIVEVSPDLAERVPANALMKQILPVIDGRGGGKPTRAEAGGRFPERLEQLYEEARRAISESIEV